MSQTIAQRHGAHVHIPLAPIVALAVAVIAAAAILVLINQPTFAPSNSETTVTAATAALPAGVPKPESPALRRQVMAQAQAAATPAQWRIMHRHPEGTTLDGFGGYVAAPTAVGVVVERRAGQFPGKAR